MILFSLDFPHEQRTVLAIILEKENLERMRQGDPATLESRNAGGTLPVAGYPQHVSILIAYLEDTAEFYEIARTTHNNPIKLLAYLEKHRQWRPGSGWRGAHHQPQGFRQTLRVNRAVFVASRDITVMSRFAPLCLDHSTTY